MPEEWEQFAVKAPFSDEAKDCQSLEYVDHVSHIQSSLQILRDGHLRPRLVSDKSKLNSTRILVNWLSPFHWGTGYRYGHICFRYKWTTLVAGMDSYWVEKISYAYPAPRILLTRKDHDNDPLVRKYDPKVDNGPWRIDPESGRHYWNPGCTLEFLVEEPITLFDLYRTLFVDHSDKYCALHKSHPASCPDFRLSTDQAGAYFVASVVARQLGGVAAKIARVGDLWCEPRNTIIAAWNKLYTIIIRPTDYAGSVTCNQAEAGPLTRAYLNALANRNRDERLLLGRLFKSADDLTQACAQLVETTFGMSVGELPRTEEGIDSILFHPRP